MGRWYFSSTYNWYLMSSHLNYNFLLIKYTFELYDIILLWFDLLFRYFTSLHCGVSQLVDISSTWFRSTTRQKGFQFHCGTESTPKAELILVWLQVAGCLGRELFVGSGKDVNIFHILFLGPPSLAIVIAIVLSFTEFSDMLNISMPPKDAWYHIHVMN